MRRLFICVMAGILALLVTGNASAQQPDREIVVWGENTQSKPPKVLRIDLTSLAIGPTAEEAIEHAAARAEEIITDFRQFGLKPGDWDEHNALTRKGLPDEPKRLAFWATVTLSVRLSDFTAAAKMLDRAHALKVAAIHYQFELDDPAAIYENALERAVDDARRRAGQLARELKVTLGPPLGCEEISSPPVQNAQPTWMRSDSVNSTENTSVGVFPYENTPVVINPHSIAVEARVRARFAIVR